MDVDGGTAIDPIKTHDYSNATPEGFRPLNKKSTHLVYKPRSHWPNHGSKEWRHAVNCHRTDKDVENGSQCLVTTKQPFVTQ